MRATINTFLACLSAQILSNLRLLRVSPPLNIYPFISLRYLSCFNRTKCESIQSDRVKRKKGRCCYFPHTSVQSFMNNYSVKSVHIGSCLKDSAYLLASSYFRNAEEGICLFEQSLLPRPPTPPPTWPLSFICSFYSFVFSLYVFTASKRRYAADLHSFVLSEQKTNSRCFTKVNYWSKTTKRHVFLKTKF